MPRSVRIDPRAFPEDTPMKLQVLARAAFPDGSVTAAGLRQEAAAGRLDVYVVAGVTMTTMAAVRRMVDQCRVKPDASLRPTSPLPSRPVSSASEAAAAQAHLRAKLARRAAPARRGRDSQT